MLRAGHILFFSLDFTALRLRFEHETGLVTHLLLERVHGAHRRLLFRRIFTTLAGLDSDILLHLLLPLSRVALVIARQSAEAHNGSFLEHIADIGLILARTKLVARVPQEVILLVHLSYLSWDAHRAQIHLVEVILAGAGAWRLLLLLLLGGRGRR